MVVNRQRQVAVKLSGLEAFLSRVCGELKLEPESVAVCLVKNSEIARLNRSYRGKAGPTDVLSFPVAEERAARRRINRNGKRPRRGIGGDEFLGDIAIAPAIARANARRYGRTLAEELRILILHGVLHLLGYDHETDRGEMDRREARLRRRLRIA
jgi:probable rRNA maturation factor